MLLILFDSKEELAEHQLKTNQVYMNNSLYNWNSPPVVEPNDPPMAGELGNCFLVVRNLYTHYRVYMHIVRQGKD